MPRVLSSALRTAIFTDLPEDEILLALITISAPGADTIRLVNNNDDVVSRGATYTAYPFELNLPTEEETGQPRARIVFDNVVPAELVPFIRTIVDKPTIKIELVRSKALNIVEVSFERFTFDEVVISNTTISGDLVMRDMSGEAYPAHTYSPAFCPALAFGFT